MLFTGCRDRETVCKMHEDHCQMGTIAFLTQPLKTDELHWFHSNVQYVVSCGVDGKTFVFLRFFAVAWCSNCTERWNTNCVITQLNSATFSVLNAVTFEIKTRTLTKTDLRHLLPSCIWARLDNQQNTKNLFKNLTIRFFLKSWSFAFLLQHVSMTQYMLHFLVIFVSMHFAVELLHCICVIWQSLVKESN